MKSVPEKAVGVQRVDFPMDELRSVMQRVLRTRLSPEAGFEVFEREALRIANTVVRQCLQEKLQEVARRQPKEVFIEGERYRRHQRGAASYHSLCGELPVERWTYRKVGERNGPTEVPLELEVGIIERCTPALAASIAHGYASGTMREHEERLRYAHREPPSRTTLERIAVMIGTEAKKAVNRIEPALRRAERLPEGASAISVGLDRTSVPMEEDKPPDEVEVHYRMAYVGTVSITNKDGDMLCARRYATAAHEDPAGVVTRMMADLGRALRQKPDLHVGLVQDGAPELWRLMQDGLDSHPLVNKYHEAIDRYHLTEHLNQLLEALLDDPDERRARLASWKKRLDESDRAIEHIRRWCSARAWTDRKRFDAAYQHLNYLDYSYRMRYATLKKLGLPVGSGVTEGACKSLIAARAKRSGQRWRPSGIDAVLALRSLQQSDRLPRFWKGFARGYQKVVTAA